MQLFGNRYSLHPAATAPVAIFFTILEALNKLYLKIIATQASLSTRLEKFFGLSKKFLRISGNWCRNSPLTSENRPQQIPIQ